MPDSRLGLAQLGLFELGAAVIAIGTGAFVCNGSSTAVFVPTSTFACNGASTASFAATQSTRTGELTAEPGLARPGFFQLGAAKIIITQSFESDGGSSARFIPSSVINPNTTAVLGLTRPGAMELGAAQLFSRPVAGAFSCDGHFGAGFIPTVPETTSFECDGISTAEFVGTVDGGESFGRFECDGASTAIFIPSPTLFGYFECDGASGSLWIGRYGGVLASCIFQSFTAGFGPTIDTTLMLRGQASQSY